MPTPLFREVYVWSGTAWESLSVAYPDLSPYADKSLNNTFTGTNTFNGQIVRPAQVPYAIEVGTVNLPTTTNGDALIIGSRSFDVGRFTQIPTVMLTVRYPTTVKNGYGTVKTTSTSLFTYEVVLDVPVTDGQAPSFPLKLDYVAIQMSA
jgi:hypothetical protein